MANSPQIFTDVFHFAGGVIPATGSGNASPFVYKDTSASGTPIHAIASGVGWQMYFDNTNEVQNVCLYQDDILPYDLDLLVAVRFWCKLKAAQNAAETITIGVGTARNDAPASIADHALFQCAGDGTIDCMTDDQVHDTSDTTGALSLSASYWKRLEIRFREGLYNAIPPTAPSGGLSDVHFYADDANNVLKRICKGTRFDLSSSTANVQLIAQIQKTAATSVGGIYIRRIEVDHMITA